MILIVCVCVWVDERERESMLSLPEIERKRTLNLDQKLVFNQVSFLHLWKWKPLEEVHQFSLSVKKR